MTTSLVYSVRFFQALPLGQDTLATPDLHPICGVAEGFWVLISYKPNVYGDQNLMFIASGEGACASTEFAAISTSASTPPPNPPGASNPCGDQPKEQTRHMIFGTPSGVQTNIRHLHKLGYADPNDWSRALSTGRPGEVMVTLTKRI